MSGYAGDGLSTTSPSTCGRTRCTRLWQEVDYLNGADSAVGFDAVEHSPRALAEAIYRRAAARFADGAQPTNPAALTAPEGALVAVRDLEAAEA